MLRISDSAEMACIVRAKAEDELKSHSALTPVSEGRELERISFSRSREVEIDWDKVISKETVGVATAPYIKGYGTEYMRRELERRWGLPEGVKKPEHLAIINDATLTVDPPMIAFAAPNSTRRYMAIVARNSEFQLPPIRPVFTTAQEYEIFWKHVESVRPYGDESQQSEMSAVDLAPALIYRQYRELKALEVLGEALSANADKIASKEFSEFLSAEELESQTAGYMRMKTVKTDVHIKLERLRDKARDLGYYLALTKEEITLPDGKKDVLDAGEIYQPYITQYHWTTVHYRRYLIRTTSLFFSSSYVLSIPYNVQHTRRITRYAKILPDFDPWLEKERELSSAGFSVFRFERIGERYVTSQGEALPDIAERCEMDVNFCNRCAVMIPVYEQALVRGEILARYIVIKRPRPGTQPLFVPRLFVEEDLQFATHFQRIEVGELVESINLAPGESREIVFEKTTLSEKETRRTATSISDLTETDRVDLSTEMEKEATSSSEKTTTQNLSAKAGGSFGGFSGSAEGSTSTTQTTRQFARDLQKIANKASRSVTRQTRQEVKTESTVRTNVSTRESTKISIENINEGRSLNLLFYQLYNIYRLSLHLERMSFTLLTGREVIAGSGIVLPEVFPLHQLGKVLERMTLDAFPITPADTSGQDPQARAKEAYLMVVLEALKTTLLEYKKGSQGSSDAVDIDNWDPTNQNPTLRDYVDALTAALNDIQYTGADINPPGSDKPTNTLVIGSPGLYLDAHVGARESTEPYSEDMRRVEWSRRLAEVKEIEARAAYHEAMARRLSQVLPDNAVTARAKDLRTLELTFAKEPLQGKWFLYVAQSKAKDVDITTPDLLQVVSFQADQQWLQASSVELARLVHESTKQELTFLI